MEFKRDQGEWFNFLPFRLVTSGGKSFSPLCMARVHRDRIWFDYVVTVTVEEGSLSSEVVYSRRYKAWGDMLSDARTLDTRGIHLDMIRSLKVGSL